MSAGRVVRRVVARLREGIRRPGFEERREIVRRGRSATWQVTIALVAATVGAAGLGYLAVQLFFLPETVAQSRLDRVPDLTGLKLEDAVEAGEDQGYRVADVHRHYSDEVDGGKVIYQVPPPETYLQRGDTVSVLVSLGPARPVVPDLAGLEPDRARRILRSLGLESTPSRREASDLHPQGTVIETVPPAGTPAARGTEVTLVLSRGGSFLAMPDVRGLPLAGARDTLEVHGLIVGEVTGVAEEQRAGEGIVVVAAQDPAAGRRVRAGSAVRLRLGEVVPETRRAVEPPPEREPLAPPLDLDAADEVDAAEDDAPTGELPAGETPDPAPGREPPPADTTAGETPR